MARALSADTQTIYRYLTHHPNTAHSTTHIAETLGLETKKVSNALQRMTKRDSVVQRTGRGKYMYVPPMEPEAEEQPASNGSGEADPAFMLDDELRVVGVLLNREAGRVEYVVEHEGHQHRMQRVEP